MGSSAGFDLANALLLLHKGSLRFRGRRSARSVERGTLDRADSSPILGVPCHYLSVLQGLAFSL